MNSKMVVAGLLVLFSSLAFATSESCHETNLTYIDKSEGGPGFYCADSESQSSADVRASESFVATCPVQFLTYIDKSEGGPGAYCACPEENMSYIDKSEGGPGAICLE